MSRLYGFASPITFIKSRPFRLTPVPKIAAFQRSVWQERNQRPLRKLSPSMASSESKLIGICHRQSDLSYFILRNHKRRNVDCDLTIGPKKNGQRSRRSRYGQLSAE